jgi:hypothetical protein
MNISRHIIRVLKPLIDKVPAVGLAYRTWRDTLASSREPALTQKEPHSLRHSQSVKEIVMQVIGKTPFYYPLRNWAVKRRMPAELAEWERKGRPVPPPHIVKQRTLREYSKRFGLRILVETGTYYGDMVEAMRADFDRIYSIELSKDLYETTKKRFKGANNIELIHGDSGNELKRIVNNINQPALFWLDGHYSAGVTARGTRDTPIYEELRHILNSKDMGLVIIIDDARSFGKDSAYPSIEELSRFIKSKRADVDITVQDDSIRITPKQYVFR